MLSRDVGGKRDANNDAKCGELFTVDHANLLTAAEYITPTLAK
jgi:hypothetical protein